ncbi:hypothetical protein SOVF_060260 [Spinacia oleracea]|nr:hypothetical protein SOVF_060260 [Spinacia oleracea]
MELATRRPWETCHNDTGNGTDASTVAAPPIDYIPKKAQELLCY